MKIELAFQDELPQVYRPRAGGPALLFDRLVDANPREQVELVPYRTLNRDELMASIAKELNLLLDSRASQLPEAWLAMEKTVLTYGLPDLAHLSPANGADVNLILRIVTQAIEAFEPRLTHVEIKPLRAVQGKFSFLIHAHVQVGSIMEPISFPITL